MEPEEYSKHWKSFLHFSDNKFRPGNLHAITKLLCYLNKKDKILEIGGGSGRLSRTILDFWPKIQITFIEPCMELMQIAKLILPESITFIQDTFNNSYNQLSLRYNSIILFKSFYTLNAFRNEYLKTFQTFNRLLENDGFVFIFDLYDIKEIEAGIVNKRTLLSYNTEMNPEEFDLLLNDHIIWLKKFCTGVRNGKYHLFQPEELASLADKTGFRPVYKEYQKGQYFCAFQKYNNL